MANRLSPKEYLTTAERVAQALRTAIANGTLAAGQPIVQEEIAARYQVSRMPVREALQQLEAEGLVVIYAGRGAFVTTLTPAEIAEIYEIRSLLEVDLLRRAFPALTPPILQQAEAILQQLDGAQESSAWSELDQAFHATLYEPAQRPRFLELVTTLRRQVTHLFYLVNTPAEYRSRFQREHRQIVDACRVGDLPGALAALEAHLRDSYQAIAQSSRLH